jgi:hypothetical protein
MKGKLVLVLLLAIIGCSSAAYVVNRNVKNYGAKGDGVTDDSNAIITALTQDRGDASGSVYPNAKYSSSTQHPAYVFFPPGTYLVTQTLPVIYYTQMVGDPSNPPTIKFVSNQGVRVLEVAGGWYTGVNQDNFYRQIRNFVIDMTQCNMCTGVHWQVAQATSITNVYFKSQPGSKAQGMWMENGSGGFFSDLVFEGGIYGIWVGNQQFTSRNITVRDVSTAAIYLNWDWVWTFKGLHIENAPVGVGIGSGVGSLVVIDSDFTNTPIAVQTQYTGSGSGEGSVYLDNVKYAQSGTIVQNAGNNVLTTNGATTVKSWAQGHIWQNGGNMLASKDISSLTPARTPSLLGSDGTYFEMTRPNYVGMTQVDVTTLGLVGDGNTDNTKALQAALNNYAGKSVLFFPHGLYNIENTVTVPAGTRMVGQVWSVLAATGSNFQNAKSPIPMLQVGNPGQTGVAQLVDFIISTKGPVPGAKLLVWNLHDPPNAPGSNGIWDVHYRIGGAIGTNIQPGNCPSGDGGGAPASNCNGAYLLLHVTWTGSLYMENVWGWAADHDIDQGAQINVYNTRGMLCESAGPVWLYGTAMEHHVLYQYNFNNAKSVFMGAIQTETPYYQPSANTPFAATRTDPSDPTFCTNDNRCNMAYGLVINNSTDIWIYSTGLYSFFNVWGQGCLQGQPSCQIEMIKVTNSKAIHAYALSTYGSLYILSNNETYSQASSNSNTFCATGVVNLNWF